MEKSLKRHIGELESEIDDFKEVLKLKKEKKERLENKIEELSEEITEKDKNINELKKLLDH